jgi:hypothetical protein
VPWAAHHLLPYRNGSTIAAATAHPGAVRDGMLAAGADNVRHDLNPDQFVVQRRLDPYTTDPGFDWFSFARPRKAKGSAMGPQAY